MSTKPAILIIEDDPDTQEVVAHLVKHLGAVPVCVSDSQELDELLDSTDDRFAAVIIDLKLPGKDGFTLLHELSRRSVNLRNTVYIACTAYHSVSARYVALDAGFTHYFPKPLDIDRFSKMVGCLIEA